MIVFEDLQLAAWGREHLHGNGWLLLSTEIDIFWHDCCINSNTKHLARYVEMLYAWQNALCTLCEICLVLKSMKGACHWFLTMASQEKSDPYSM